MKTLNSDIFGILRTGSRFSRALIFFGVGMALGTSSAHAGHWAVEMSITTSYDAPDANYHQPPTTVIGSSDTSSGSVADWWVNTSNTHLVWYQTVKSGLSWVPDYEGDLPPLKVYVVEAAWVYGTGYVAFEQGVDVPPIGWGGTDNGYGAAEETAMDDTGEWIFDNGYEQKYRSFGKEWRTTKLYIRSNQHRDSKLELFTRTQVLDFAPPKPPDGVNSLGLGDMFLTDHIYVRPPEISANRKGTADSTNLAAGGFGTDEHRADVWASLSPPDFGIVDMNRIDISVIQPKIINGLGVVRDAKYEAEGNAITVNGKAKIGTFTSSDKATPSGKRVTLRLQAGLGTLNPSVVLTQHWDHSHNWKSGVNGDQPVPNTFYYGSDIPYTFRPNFEVPITGHTMDFIADTANVTTWDPVGQVYITDTFFDDRDFFSGAEYPPTPNAGYATFLPASAGGGPAYSTNMNITYDAQKLVNWVLPAAEDHDTFKAAELTPP